MEKYLSELQGLWDKALVDAAQVQGQVQAERSATRQEARETQAAQLASDNQAHDIDAQGTKNTATESGKKRYMARNFTMERNVVGFRDFSAIRIAVSNAAQEIIDKGGTVSIETDIVDEEEKNTDWTNGKAGRQRLKEILEDALGIPVTLGADGMSLEATLTRDGIDHAIKGNNTGRKAAIFSKFLELAGRSIYSFSTPQDRQYSKASAKITDKALWDNFVGVAEIAGKNYPVVFSVRSIDSDVRGQIYEAWIKKEAEATRGAGTQEKPANGQPSYGDQSTSGSKISQKNKDVKALGRKSERNYNDTVVLEEKTIDKYLADYASKSSPNYAQAYIVRMRPTDFLDLTTSRVGRNIIASQTQDLDTEKLKSATRHQPFQLHIDTETGQVEGHEGRHRAMALYIEGIRSIPVLLFDSRNKYSKTALDTLDLKGQEFGDSRSDATVRLTDVQPLSYANRENIVQKYTTQPAWEKYFKKAGTNETIRYQQRDYSRLGDEEVIARQATAESTDNPETRKMQQQQPGRLLLF